MGNRYFPRRSSGVSEVLVCMGVSFHITPRKMQSENQTDVVFKSISCGYCDGVGVKFVDGLGVNRIDRGENCYAGICT